MAGAASKGFLQPLYGLLERGALGQLGDAELLERFTRRDEAEAAFEALVVRHGPAVMRVCLGILGGSADAEDVFQATFLLLARRADSIARPQALGAWLHGVARRIALKAKVAEARRKKHERRLAQRASPIRAAAADLGGRLHEELDRLPESLRDPVVLCYLEEMSYQSAARRLGLSEGTIRGRLVKARDRLRSRLAREGGIPEVGAERRRPDNLSVRGIAVPWVLFAATTRAAVRSTAGRPGNMGVSAAVIELMHGGLSMMFVTRLKIAATVVAAFGLAMAGAAALATRPADTTRQEPLPAGASGAVASASIVRAATQNKMTLEEAIERTVRENAEPLARRMGIAAGEINRLLARFRSDGSNDTAGPREVVVAQFQDAMRNQIDTVYKCFVDVEATQERLRLASATLDKWERLLNATGSVVEQGARPGTDVERIRAARDLARSKRDDARTSLTRARAGLCSELNLPVVGREPLEVASRISRLRAAVLPEVDELVRLALAIRPDLAGYRLGKKRAEADVATAQANRISDTYLLYSPYTFAGVSGLGMQRASWALGVRLPIYESAQGRMARAKLNLDQTQIQIASMERQVSEEVAGVHLTCELCKSELSRSEARALAEAARRRDSAEREYLAPARNGGLPLSRTLETLLSDWHECEKAESRHLEILVRYLRNALELNTAVGKRIMP